jgi:1-acyl-sn-glycerol-3-phosphate acyltransferase
VKLVQAVRSGLFYALFLGQTVILAIIVGTVGIVLRRRTEFGWRLGSYWGRSNLWLLKFVVGIRTRVLGRENMPQGPCIIASKHQSDWDIFAILPLTTRPAFIAKKELMRIPFFGWAAASIDTIEIDRALGAEAIPAMIESARAALSRGCQIIIFPEGTRKAPFAAPDYRQGIARLYDALGVPVVPIALNSGIRWGRNSLVLWPGTSTASVLPAIPPGLGREAFRDKLVATIEPETERLMLEGLAEGPPRPIPPAWQARLDELRRGTE